MTIHLLYFYATSRQENSMERWWFNSMVFQKELKHSYHIKKSTNNLDPVENTSKSEDPNRKGRAKNIQNWGDHDNSSSSNVDHFFGVKDIRNFISDDTFLVSESNGDSFYIYFDIENQIFDIENDHSFLSELESSYRNFRYMTNGYTSKNDLYNHYMYDTQSSWNNHITSCIDSYLQSQICIDTSIVIDSSDNYISGCVFDKRRTSSEGEGSSIQTNAKKSDLTLPESSNDLDATHKYKHLWVLCENENCYGLNYKKFLKSKMNICEYCGYHFKISSSERIELLIDPGTWDPMDEDMVSLDAIEFHSEEPYQHHQHQDLVFDSEEEPYKHLLVEDPSQDLVFDSEEEFYKHLLVDLEEEFYKEFYKLVEDLYEVLGFDSKEEFDKHLGFDSGEEFDKEFYKLFEDPYQDLVFEEPYQDRIDSYQIKTGLTEAVQTGIGQLNGLPIAIGVMDFQFMGGSMGCVVGEKITRLIEYATKQFLPLIIVCASGGARMQEGSLSLMQMAKIASALYDYQSNKKLLYVSILTSPTTGGVTASFGMLGDIIIAEPDSYIAFAGKRVIEQTLNITVPEGSQTAEYLFPKGLFDLIVPRNLLKSVLSEFFKLHAFVPLNSNSLE